MTLRDKVEQLASDWHEGGYDEYADALDALLSTADSEQREDVLDEECTNRQLRIYELQREVADLRRKLEATDSLAQEVVWLLDNVRAIQSADKSEEWWTRRNALLARIGGPK